VSDLYGN